jgi:hypothetical protein
VTAEEQLEFIAMKAELLAARHFIARVPTFLRAMAVLEHTDDGRKALGAAADALQIQICGCDNCQTEIARLNAPKAVGHA